MSTSFSSTVKDIQTSIYNSIINQPNTPLTTTPINPDNAPLPPPPENLINDATTILKNKFDVANLGNHPLKVDADELLKQNVTISPTVSFYAPVGVYFYFLLVTFAFASLMFTGTFGASLENPRFLISQAGLSFYLIVSYTFLYGILFQLASHTPNIQWVRDYMYFLIPLGAMSLIFTKNLLTYAVNLQSHCNLGSRSSSSSPIAFNFKTSLMLWNCLKPVFSIFLVYLFISVFNTFFQLPFFELFNSNHEIIHFIATGFWLGCAVLPAEASAYFSLQKFGCMPTDNIELQEVSNLPDLANPPTTST